MKLPISLVIALMVGCSDTTNRGRTGADFDFELIVRCKVDCEVQYRASRTQHSLQEGQARDIDPSKLPIPLPR